MGTGIEEIALADILGSTAAETVAAEVAGTGLAAGVGEGLTLAGATGTGAGLAATAGEGLTLAGATGAGAGLTVPAGFDIAGGIGAGLGAGSALPAGFGGASAAVPGAPGGEIAGSGLTIPASMGGASMPSASFLPVTGAGPGISSLSPELAQSLGVVQQAPAELVGSGGAAGMTAPAGFDIAPGVGGSGLDSVATGAAGGATGMTPPPGFDIAPNAGRAGTGFMDTLKSGFGKVGEWAMKNPAQAGMLGLSGINALHTPQLPGAAKSALNASSSAVQQAQGILASGGTSSPQWQTQKGAIDQSIDASLRNAIEQMVQQAQNSGQGGRDSAVVQQQINRLQQQADTQRQQLYSQALSQIVSNAVAEMSGGNATLGSIAQMQMAGSQEARQSAAQTAELALLLGGKQ